MAEHEYIVVGSRRWCTGCDTYQIYRNGRWRDDKSMTGPWPGYAVTEENCPKIYPLKDD